MITQQAKLWKYIYVVQMKERNKWLFQDQENTANTQIIFDVYRINQPEIGLTYNRSLHFTNIYCHHEESKTTPSSRLQRLYEAPMTKELKNNLKLNGDNHTLTTYKTATAKFTHMLFNDGHFVICVERIMMEYGCFNNPSFIA